MRDYRSILNASQLHSRTQRGIGPFQLLLTEIRALEQESNRSALQLKEFQSDCHPGSVEFLHGKIGFMALISANWPISRIAV